MKQQVTEAAKILKAGGVVAYPTESFYGLAVDIQNERAIGKLFSVKGRAPGEPVLLLIPAVESVEFYAARVPKTAKRLMETFWPGGLTLVFEAKKEVSSLLTAGTGKIGLRVSSHPVAVALSEAMGSAITGTSANLSGAPPCSKPEAVSHVLGSAVDKVLNGGETPGQKPSTVLDLTKRPHTILREGLVSREMLQPFCEEALK